MLISLSGSVGSGSSAVSTVAGGELGAILVDTAEGRQQTRIGMWCVERNQGENAYEHKLLSIRVREGRMKRFASVLLVVSVMLIPNAVLAETTTNTVVVDQPITGMVHCDGRDIALEGNMRMASHWTIDGTGTIHLHTTWLMYNTSGLDQYGDRYRAVSAHPQVHSNTSSDWTGQDIVVASANHAQFIGLGTAPNFGMSWSAHLTFNHHGELVAERYTYNTECWH